MTLMKVIPSSEITCGLLTLIKSQIRCTEFQSHATFFRTVILRTIRSLRYLQTLTHAQSERSARHNEDQTSIRAR